MKYKGLFTLILALVLSTPALAQQPGLHITDPWVREAPPAARVLAAYMVIMNNGAADVAITAASSPQFGRIELHSTRMENGMARMVKEEQIVVPAGGSVSLKPGGMHMMLFDPSEAISAGKQVMITLQTATGDSIMVHAEVRKGDAMGQGMNNMHSHGHMH